MVLTTESGDMPWEKAPFLVGRVIDVGFTGLASQA
jgi:hypothetical protein